MGLQMPIRIPSAYSKCLLSRMSLWYSFRVIGQLHQTVMQQCGDRLPAESLIPSQQESVELFVFSKCLSIFLSLIFFSSVPLGWMLRIPPWPIREALEMRNWSMIGSFVVAICLSKHLFKRLLVGIFSYMPTFTSFVQRTSCLWFCFCFLKRMGKKEKVYAFSLFFSTHIVWDETHTSHFLFFFPFSKFTSDQAIIACNLP